MPLAPKNNLYISAKPPNFQTKYKAIYLHITQSYVQISQRIPV
jgi:hypothetical protein